MRFCVFHLFILPDKTVSDDSVIVEVYQMLVKDIDTVDDHLLCWAQVQLDSGKRLLETRVVGTNKRLNNSWGSVHKPRDTHFSSDYLFDLIGVELKRGNLYKNMRRQCFP